jgi:hypothetical protein
MIDVEPLIARELDRLLPTPNASRANWPDVLERAGVGGRLPRRRIALGFAVVLAVLVSATAVAKTFGGFDEWLRGAPGEAANERAQERFETANGRSWAAFPTTTRLRELIRTTSGGVEYVLYGFRSGKSLCLKLAAAGNPFQPGACAPASLVAAIDSPVVVVMGNFTFVDRASRPTAFASFGIAADEVVRVEAEATDGRHRAFVGGNAYLVLEHRPNTSTRVTRITATNQDGGRVHVPVTMFGRAGSVGPAPGPTEIEARIRHPRVAWYDRGEPRGVSANQVALTRQQRAWLRGSRLVKPDPFSDFVVGLSGQYCMVTLRGKGCNSDPFQRGPLWVGGSGGYSEFLVVHGVAADGVRRITIYLADGQQIRAPLRHNLFAALVPTARFPIRVVAYDGRDRVVGIDSQLGRFLAGEPVPAAAKQVEPTRAVTGPGGATVRLSIGPRVGGFECWRIDFGDGVPIDECTGPPLRSITHLRVAAVRQVRRDLFVVGEANPAVTRVELRFSDGEKLVAVPVRGKFAFAIPPDQLSRTRRRAFVVTFDANGTRRGRQRIFYRLD